MDRATMAVIVAAMGTVLAGCQSRPSFEDSDRSQRLMSMAGRQTEQIADPKDRLARQLRLANGQIGDHYFGDAHKSLLLARTTLEAVSDKLDDHTRLAGWVSIAQLSRRSNDHDGAVSAGDRAVALLRQIQPLGNRVPFVWSISEELYEIKGRAAAVALLQESGNWIVDISAPPERRQAMVAVSAELFRYDEYDSGEKVLQHDADAAWRADTLLDLADRARPSGHFWMSGAAMAQSANRAYSKDLSFEANFSASKK